MKKKYLLFIVPIIVLSLIFVIYKIEKRVSIKDNIYSSAYSKLALNVLKNKANKNVGTNYEDGNKGEMYAFSHNSTMFVPKNTDYRYIGDDPNNYVYFNCSDIYDTSTCEVWRIIGVFEVDIGNNKYEERIKIVRSEPFDNAMSYDSSDDNNWISSDLNSFLNEDYYYRRGSAETYGLYESARNIISDTKYYLGGVKDTNSTYGNVDQFYDKERTDNFYDANNVRRNTKWDGKIGLIYPSDFYYVYGKGVDDTCFDDPMQCVFNHAKNGWFFKSLLSNGESDKSMWFITPYERYIGGSYSNASVYKNGIFVASNPRTLKYIYPTIYLSTDAIVSSGIGTKEHPYHIMSREDYINQDFDYKIGDAVYYNNELYYVVDNSKKDSDYVVALKDVPLSEKNLISEKNLNDIGNLTFDFGKKCYNRSEYIHDYSGCTSDFNSSYIRKFLDKWGQGEFDSNDLVEVYGYKVRLITVDEIYSALKYQKKMLVTTEVITTSDESPDFVKNRDFSCWSMNNYEDSNSVATFGTYLSSSDPYFSQCVEPVVNIRKSSIGDNNEFHMGDQFKYKNVDYYVISDSLSDIDYVTAIRVEPLNLEQILKYSNSSINSYSVGFSPYFSEYSSPVSFEISDVKKVIDRWIDNTFDDDDLVTVDGLKGRLISVDELLENFYYDYKMYLQNSTISSKLVITDNTPSFIYSYSYWTETLYEDDGQSAFVVTSYGDLYPKSIRRESSVRPIVYLKKSAIGKIGSKYKEVSDNIIVDGGNNIDEVKCTPKYKKETITKYNEYKIGDEITYNGDKYYVIDNSDNEKNYVTVLKDEMFKNYELMNSEAIKEMIRLSMSTDDTVGEYQFYKSDTCNGNATIDCENTFNKSLIKPIIENWAKIETNEDDLISIDNSKVRLLNDNDLINLGFDKESSSTYVLYGSNPFYSWLSNENYEYWTMINFEDSNSIIYVDKTGRATPSQVFSKYAVRPVINLSKTALGDKKNYDVGDKVTYMNNDYYVIESSDESKNYVVLLKDIPFTTKQIEAYSDLDILMNVTNDVYKTYYYINDKCTSKNNIQECRNDFDSSNVKGIIYKWIKEKDIEKDLIDVDGYKFRLLNVDDFFNNLGYTDEIYKNQPIYVTNLNVPKWIYNKGTNYWTMVSNFYSDYGGINSYSMFIVLDNGFLGSQLLDSINDIYVFNSYAIRPVLNLNKCAIEGGCEVEEIEIEDGCLEDDGINVVDVPSTLSIISKIVLIISGILVLLGCSFIGYNYYIARKERK